MALPDVRSPLPRPGAQVEPNGQIMLTYRCSAACRHCLVMSSQKQPTDLVPVERAVEYGRDFHQLGRRVIIAGGEALLFAAHVERMARALMDAGIPVAFVESNGSWCVSDELVTQRLTRLRACGVQGMYFSIDAYHQEFVPAERVMRGVRIAIDVFGDEYVYAPRVVPEAAGRLAGVVADAARLRAQVQGSSVRFIGRAADALAPLAAQIPLAQLLAQDCRADLDVDHLKEIQVDPFGHVRPDMCPGVNLGTTSTDRIVDVARTAHVRRTPLLRDLADGGPASLLPMARSRGFRPADTYASKCHLCFSIRRQLVGDMPREFGPAQAYAAPG